MLKIENLSICYEGNSQTSVENFNLEVAKGEIVCIVGESGSGKSSILKAVLGALSKSVQIKGEIMFEERALLDQSLSEWQNIRGTKLSMIFQDSNGSLNPVRKIGKQYEEYIIQHEPMNTSQARERAKAMLKKMDLHNAENILNSFPHQLSGGMTQRVSIAIALTFTPEVLLADEPTSALDVVIQKQVVEELLRVRKNFNTAIVLVTHNLALGAYMADKLIVMEKGRIVDSGAVLDVLEHPKSIYTKKLLAAVPELEREAYV
ncbi:ABC transporter ATP-binding protein [Enterococcus sp. AZ196]|uniref:ABC transporter ATP-binding protein n=1 Tax=Enterococcus sp. AZ196 TaxID=2774659 RepID=UPI003D2D03A4